MNLHTYDYLAYRVNEVHNPRSGRNGRRRSLFVLSHHPRSTLVQSCNDVMEFEKFIGGKFKTST
jgi:hypothetical protein